MEQTGARRINGTKQYSEDYATSRPRAELSNAVARLCYKMAGSARKYYELTVDERLSMRSTARQMYDLGADFMLATKAEGTEKRGFVYVITHPAFPGYVKIGRAFDPQSRLNGYQTGCPRRAYELEHAVYFHDCVWAEKEMHLRMAFCRAEGEWFNMTVHNGIRQIEALRGIL